MKEFSSGIEKNHTFESHDINETSSSNKRDIITLDYLYKVILVDDEEDVRHSIAKKIDWKNLGFELVGEAGNGEEALNMAEKLQPDVILTDIKMPFMDGLELCRRLRNLNSSIKIAIFSGFDEFEYAKEAIHLDVQEFILKPIDAKELTQVFMRIKSSIDHETNQKRNLDRLRKHYEQSLPLFRQQLLVELLHGKNGTNINHQSLKEFGLDFDINNHKYCVAVVKYELDSNINQLSNKDMQMLSLSLSQLMQERLNPSLQSYIVDFLDHFSIIFILNQHDQVETVVKTMNQLFMPAKKLLGLNLSVGIGNVYSSINEIHLSAKEAQNVLDYQILYDPGYSIFIGDIEPNASSISGWDRQYITDIIKEIKIGNENTLNNKIHEFIGYIKKSNVSILQYQICMLELSSGFLEIIKSYKLDSKQADIDSLLNYQLTMNFNNMDKLEKWLFEYCNNLRELIGNERKDSTFTLINSAKEHIFQNYSDINLSVESICSILNVSATYFSTVFKKETGCRFISYLTDIRMEKALEYLNTTDLKTYQIAEKVGYADPNYFSYVFKQKYSVSPSKYRTKASKSND